MSDMEYGRHAPRLLEWDDVEIADEPTPVADLSHGSVFSVDDQAAAEKPKLMSSLVKFLNRKVV